MRYEYPVLKQEKNGYWYVYFSRRNRESLLTKDRGLAEKIFRMKRNDWIREQSKKVVIFDERRDGYNFDEYAKLYQSQSAQWKKAETRRIDSYILKRFCDYQYKIPETEKVIRVGTLRPDTQGLTLVISAFHASMLEDCEKSSLNVYIRHLKSIFAYGVTHEIITKDPYAKIKQYKLQKEPVRVLTDDEIKKILNIKPKPYFKPDPDFLLMIEVYLHTGCRCREIVELKLPQVNKDHITILNTKTGQFRIVELNDYARKLFSQIPRVNNKELNPDKRLFPRWRHQTVSHMFLYYARQVGINDVNLHDLRHTFASRCLEGSMGLATLQVLMGHESINTTIKFYGHLSREHIKKEINKIQYGYNRTTQTKIKGVVSNGND